MATIHVNQLLLKRMSEADKNAILIHGLGGYGDQGWFIEVKEFLESKGYVVYSPSFPNTNHPDYTEWKKFFEDNLLPKVNEDTIFIAHSLGPTFLIKYLSEKNLHLKTVIFVSPAVRKNPDLPEIDAFFENFKLPKVKNSIENIYILYSNDPYIPQEDFKYLLSELEATEVYKESREHFTQSEPTNEEVLELLSNILN